MEPPATADYRGLTVCKTAAWGQGPAGLQQLMILAGIDVANLGEAELVHVLTEAAKLAFADRDASYGDADVPLDRLLSQEYAAERLLVIDEQASGSLRPGGRAAPGAASGRRRCWSAPGEPTRGDTVHVDVADRFGNMMSATPSGGWLQSSPTIPALGWPLGTRAQMFWLEEGLPLDGRARQPPRTTLSPGLVLRDGEPWLAYGTPGGDQQEQWSPAGSSVTSTGLNLQEAIDAPEWHTDHLISSFYPRGFKPRSLIGRGAVPATRSWPTAPRGHDVTVAPPWSLGRVSAVAREGDTEGRGEPAHDAGLRRLPLTATGSVLTRHGGFGILRA